jgi:hypothetical protein
VARVGNQTLIYNPGDTIQASDGLEWGFISFEELGTRITSDNPELGTITSPTGYLKIRYILKNTGSNTLTPNVMDDGFGTPWLSVRPGESMPPVFFNAYLLNKDEIGPDSGPSKTQLPPGKQKTFTVIYELPHSGPGSYFLELHNSHITFTL